MEGYPIDRVIGLDDSLKPHHKGQIASHYKRQLHLMLGYGASTDCAPRSKVH